MIIVILQSELRCVSFEIHGLQAAAILKSVCAYIRNAFRNNNAFQFCAVAEIDDSFYTLRNNDTCQLTAVPEKLYSLDAFRDFIITFSA